MHKSPLSAWSLISRFVVATAVAALLVVNPPMPSSSLATPGCEALSLVNGDFEVALPVAPATNYYWGDFQDASQNQVPGIGWLTTQSNHAIEYWIGDPLVAGGNGPDAFDGKTFVELNASQVGALYQDVATVPGTAIVWSLAHRGRSGVDTMTVKIGDPAVLTSLGSPTGALKQGPDFSDGTSAWGVHTGVYVVPANQVLTRFWFESVTSVGGASYGNFLDGISFTPYNCSSETPTYSPPTIAQTADGFTFQLTNYDATGMSATATVGRATIAPDGLVTLTQVPANTAASVTITNHHDGFLDASVHVDANSLGSALVPKFETPTEITNGFTTQITNYNSSFNWTVNTSDSSTASVNSTGLITVTNSPTASTIVPVVTTRTSYVSGSAFVKISSVGLPPVVFTPVVVTPPSAGGSSSSNSTPIQVIAQPEPIVRKPVSAVFGGFKNGSSVLTSDMKKRIKSFIAKHSDYKSIAIKGFTEGPSILKRDYALSRQRAFVALGFIKSTSTQMFDYSKIDFGQQKKLGSAVRRIEVTLRD